MNHFEVRQLLGAYALDAVETDEQEMVEGHLRDCGACGNELAEHRETVAFLTPGWARAPEGVWDRIAGSLEEKPPPLDLAPVVPLRPTGSRGAWATGLVAAVALVVIGLMGVKIVDDGRRIDRLAAGVHSEELRRAANAALVDPGADKVALRSEDGAWFAEAVVLDDGNGYLVRHNLPPLSPDRTYQLWALAGTSKVSVGVLGPSPEVAAFRATGPVWALAITEEPAGGVVSTERQPLVLGRTTV
jgi:hypothetical protein